MIIYSTNFHYNLFYLFEPQFPVGPYSCHWCNLRLKGRLYHFFVRLRQIFFLPLCPTLTRRYANVPFAVRSLYNLAHLCTELVLEIKMMKKLWLHFQQPQFLLYKTLLLLVPTGN